MFLNLWFDEALSHELGDEVLHGLSDLVRAETAKHDDLLEVVQLVPLARKILPGRVQERTEFAARRKEYLRSHSSHRCGSGLSKIILKPGRWFLKSSANSAKRSSEPRVRISFQERAEIQSGLGLGRSFGLCEPPASRKRHSF